MADEGTFEKLARKFGMMPRPADSELTRRCWGCGDAFVSRDPQQRYCTKNCKLTNKPNAKKDKPAKINYSAYIVSDDWKRKAEAAKKRAGNRCQVCNRGTSEVLQLEAHHRTYENLGDEQPGDITVLCNECHELFSKNKKQG